MTAQGQTCRLYLITPDRFDAETFGRDLASVLDSGDVACVEVRLASADAGDWLAAVASLRPIAQDRGVAILLADRADLARSTGCDGVVLSSAAAYRPARRIVGEQAIVGVLCGSSRHDAMVAAEAGADFVGFAPDPELIAWWTEVMEPPCVAFAEGDAAAECVAAGADFLALRGTVWDHPEGAAAGLAQALGIAVESR